MRQLVSTIAAGSRGLRPLRPPVPEALRRVRVTGVRLPAKLHQTVWEIARQRNTTYADVVEAALLEYLERRR